MSDADDLVGWLERLKSVDDEIIGKPYAVMLARKLRAENAALRGRLPPSGSPLPTEEKSMNRRITDKMRLDFLIRHKATIEKRGKKMWGLYVYPVNAWKGWNNLPLRALIDKAIREYPTLKAAYDAAIRSERRGKAK